MKSNYTKIFVGNSIIAKGIINQLEEIGIVAVVKNEGESARMAGFASAVLDETELYVHNDELEKANAIVSKIKM